METETQKRVRKSPQQQIDDAKAALSRALQRQRQVDTRAKIIVGGLAQNWLLSNPSAGRAFVGYLRSIELRDQDTDVIGPLMQELDRNAQTLPKPPGD